MPGRLPQLLTVLCTQLIRAFRAAQRGVGRFAEALGIENGTDLPDQKGKDCHTDKRERIETAGEYER